MNDLMLFGIGSASGAALGGGNGGGGGGGPSFVASDSSNSSGSGVTFLEVPVPAGVADDDLLYAFIVCDDNTVSFNTPVGWILVDQEQHVGVGSMTCALFRKVASSEPASYNFELSMFGNGRMCGIMGAFRTATHSTITTEQGLDNNAVNTFTVSSVSHTEDGMIAMFVCTNDDGDGGTMPPASSPTGWELAERVESGSGSGSLLVGAKLVYKSVSGNSSTGDVVFQTESLDGGDVDYFISQAVFMV